MHYSILQVGMQGLCSNARLASRTVTADNILGARNGGNSVLLAFYCSFVNSLLNTFIATCETNKETFCLNLISCLVLKAISARTLQKN